MDQQRGGARFNYTTTRGITLLEVMMTLCVAGVILGFGVPSFSSALDRTRTTTVSNRLLTDLARARGEALLSRGHTTICPSADASSCLGGSSFSQGWVGFRDRDADGALDAGESVFVVTQSSDLHGRRVATTQGRRALRFRADGRNAGTNLTLRVCDATGMPQRVVIVNVGGRARIAPPPRTALPCP